MLNLSVDDLTQEQSGLIPSNKLDQTEVNLLLREKIHTVVKSAGISRLLSTKKHRRKWIKFQHAQFFFQCSYHQKSQKRQQVDSDTLERQKVEP